MGQMVELCYGDAKDGRSTSCATNHCIKTYQNTSKLQTNPKQIVGYFLGFSNLGKKKLRMAINSACVRGNPHGY
jgi:hypothetical protein